MNSNRFTAAFIVFQLFSFSIVMLSFSAGGNEAGKSEECLLALAPTENEAGSGFAALLTPSGHVPRLVET